MDLKGKIVVITGAARGIGAAAAKEYGLQGARVVLADINLALQETLVSELRAAGQEAYAYKVDVSNDKEVVQFAVSVNKEVGIPDIVHNNAAVVQSGSILDLEIDDFQRQMDVNVMGYLRVTKAFLPAMIERGNGLITITASPNGITPPPMVAGNMAAYCLCKSANVSTAQCLAVTLKPLGIQVSVLFPPLTNTEGGREIQGKASAEFHKGLAHAMTTFGTSPEVVAQRLVAGVKEGKFFVSAHPGYDAALKAWAENEMDPQRDWLREHALV